MSLAQLPANVETLIERVGVDIFSPAGDRPLPPTIAGGDPVVARPSDEEMLSKVLAAANDLGLKIAPVGSGSKLDRGNPASRIDLLLDMSGFNSIVDYSADDLIVSAQAGMKVADFRDLLAQEGQFLALDPPFLGTIGGLIATADSGPRRLRFGGVRDQLLGLTFVRADGVVAHGGGKVVKNVAGYDLPKLFAGSLGTLGVITSATFRLYSVPFASATMLAPDCSPLEATSLAAKIIDSPLTPTILDYTLSGGSGNLAIRFETQQSSITDQVDRVQRMFAGRKSEMVTGDDEVEVWRRADAIAATPLLARLIAPPASLGPLLDFARQAAEKVGALLIARAHMGHGHALVSWDGLADGDYANLILALRTRAEQAGGNLVLWRGGPKTRALVEAWGDPGPAIAVMRRIKAEFDPRNTLNPGRFVGGI